MSKILYFYPHKFSKLTDGIHTRIITILQYFKSRGFSVDMVSYENVKLHTSYMVDQGLVNAVYYVDKPIKPQVKLTLADRLLIRIKNLICRIFSIPSTILIELPNEVDEALVAKIISLEKEQKYAALLITYSYWGGIVRYLKEAGFNGKTVIDTTDFLTLQQYYGRNQILSTTQIGYMFGQEIERMKQFDDIIHISYDELFTFSGFITSSCHYYIPQFFEQKQQVKNISEIRYEILFLGSDNPYNVEGLQWFLQEVYPLLEKDIRIALAGKICNHVPFEASNITRLGFVDDSAALYELSLITICPLKRGTGMKIKVIESLSQSTPVVSTSKGVDGFYNKIPSGGVLIGDTPEMFAKHIQRLIHDQKYYQYQCAEAQQLFTSQFSTDINFNKLDDIFIKLRN